MATPYSPLRPRGDTFTPLDRAADRFGEEQDVARGLVRAATGMTASGLADEALRREVAGQEGWEARRDAALATQQEAAAYAPRISSLRDASGIGDVVDYIQGAGPGAAVTTLPSLGAALLTRGRWKPAAFAGAAAPSYFLSRGEIAGEQYADPTLSKASVEERDRAATYGGAAMAGLEAIVPGSLANSVLRKPARGFLNQMGRDAVTEGLTEVAQTGIQQFAHNTVDPTRGYDGWEMLDAGVAGAAGGAGLGGAMRASSRVADALLDRAQLDQNSAGDPPAAEGDGGPAPGPIDPNTPLLPAPTTFSDRAADLYETLNERFRPQAAETYEKASDYIGDVMDRMNEAIKTAETPQDFIRSVFRPPVEEVAAADLVPDEADPGVLNAADPAAAMLDRDAQRQERAASFATELLNDPATPTMIKDRIAAMGGDYSSKSNQAYLASTLIAVKGGQKVADAVDSVVEFSKSFVDKAKTVASDAKGRVSKKNLQDINEADITPLVSLMAQRLGPAKAAEAPKLARQLIAAANRLSPDARITEETDRRLRNFSEAINDEVLDLVTELSGSDALRNSIAKIRAIPSARDDIGRSNGQSFFESMLKQPLEPAVMGQLADFVDTLGLQLNSMPAARKNQVLGALASAFGSKREAQIVAEYYGNIRRDAFRREAEAGKLHEDRPSADAAPGEVVATLENPDGTVSYGAEFGSLTEQDAAEMTASYRDPNPARPFFRATDRAALRDARRAAPAGSRVATLREYVAQTGEAPQAVAARIRQDLRKRLANSENRDTATVQEAIAAMEAIPEAGRSEDFNTLLSQLKARKTENRTDLPGLRKQMEAIEKTSGVSFREVADLNKRIRRAELADEGDIDNGDVANLPALRKQLAEMEDRYIKNAEKVLEKYAVVMRPKDETFANDELMAKFRGILDKLPNANVGTPAQRAEAKDKIAKIKKTAIKFNRKGGKTPITLSAESMAYASQARGSMEERFLDSMAAVLARPDIEGLVTPAADTLISRQTGLTWGDIAPEQMADTRTERQKKAQREKATTAAWAKQERMRLDIETRPKLLAALRDAQRRFLADRLGLTLAPDEAISLTDLIDRFPAAQRRAMRTAANELTFHTAVGWAQQLGHRLAKAGERNYTDESRMRVLEKYLREQVEDQFPMPEGDERASRRIAAEEQTAGMYADESSIGGAILDIEAELDMLEERIDALASVPWVARGYRVKYARLMEDADRLADSVGTPERRDVRVPGSRADESFEVKGDRLVESSISAHNRAKMRVRKNSFVGAKADPEGASDAEALLGVGAPADLVWAELGWFRGPDGKMRKEVRSPVLKSRVAELAGRAMNGKDGELGTIGELLKGIPEFAAYMDSPITKGVIRHDNMVGEAGAVGSFNPETNELTLSLLGAKLGALINHIGEREASKMIKDLVARKEAADGFSLLTGSDFVDMLSQRAGVSGDALLDMARTELQSTALHELQHAFQAVEGFENGGTAYTAIIAKYGDVDEYKAAIADNDYETMNTIAGQAQSQLAAEYGPDADLERIAHDLYEDIMGEVEANDVQQRMKLSDAEAASLKPALADAKREYLRSLLGAVAMSYVRGANPSAMGAKKGRPKRGDKATEKAIRDEIRRIRGPQVKVLFDKLHSELGASGEFSMNADKTNRIIEVAINAANPLGTARHESLHDFFAMLDETPSHRSIKKDLIDASNAPHVKKRLRELLAKHPKAREQLDNAEERVAYMYQFWAEGELQLGPTGNGIFEKIRRFFRDVFNLISADERAADLLTALHEGRFADPSTVAEVLADMPRDRISNRLNKSAPMVTDVLQKMMSVAPERLRAFQNDHLNELADKFMPEKGGTGFTQNNYQQQAIWENKLAGVLRGSTAVERRQAIEQLQAMKPESKLAKDLAAFNKEMYAYMRDAGVKSWDSEAKKFVPLREVQNYFTRSWDRDAIARNRDEFIQLLMTEGKVPRTNAEALTSNLERGSEQRPKPSESPVDLGFMPYAPHTAERVLTFINQSNADKFAKFQQKDLADIMTSYVRSAVHRSEYARSFGNNGEQIVELVAKSGVTDAAELKTISNSVQALEGSLDPGNWSSDTKEAMSAVMTLQNLVIMPLAIVSQMIDPIVLAARTGDIRDAGKAYMTALTRLKNTITKNSSKVSGEELAEILGVVSEDSTLQAMAMAYGTTRMSKRMENINRVFFKYNGMQGWNNSMRIAATAAGERYLIGNKTDEKALAELGLTPKDVKVGKNGRLDVSSPKVQQAMFKFVDQAVLRPSPADRPVWMSDPRFLLVAHLKQFTFAMHNVVLKRASQQLEDGNVKPWAILMLATPTILAADMAKFAIMGGGPPGWEFKDYLVHAVERSGLLGLGDFGVQATRGVDMGKMPGEGLLGPAFEHLMEVLRWAGGDPRVDFGDVVDRTVPGARFI